MPTLEKGLPPEEKIILAIDTSSTERADELAEIANQAGAWVVKIGLEYSSATSWRESSTLAERHNLQWVADAKIDDIPNTTEGIVSNLLSLEYPPIGITIHTNSGVDSMRVAGDLTRERGASMIAVTHLTSVGAQETIETYGIDPAEIVARRTGRVVEADIGAIVCSALELEMLSRHPGTRHLFTMVPGTRSVSVDTEDQKRSTTPAEAVANGADLLVIGRQITNADDPRAAYEAIVEEIG